MSLPNAPRVALASNVYIQPPLSRRGVGPAVILFIPSGADYEPNKGKKSLDPLPALKWAEEGFAVLAVTTSSDGWGVKEIFTDGLDALMALTEVDTRDKVAIIVLDPKVILELGNLPSIIKCAIFYGSLPTSSASDLPSLAHLPKTFPPNAKHLRHIYPQAISPYFVLPNASSYHPASASIAHTRSLVFIKSHLGGPYFDIEAVWEEHTLYEFGERNVEKTMATMVAEPYVNHVPTGATVGEFRHTIPRLALTDPVHGVLLTNIIAEALKRCCC